MSLPEDPKDGVEAKKEGGEVVATVDAKPQAQYAETPVIAAETKYATLLESGNFSRAVVLAGVASFLERGPVDPTDLSTINTAVEIASKPDITLEDSKKQSQRILEVASGYYMQGEEPPAEIDAFCGYLIATECVTRMNLVEAELARGDLNSQEIETHMPLLISLAITLSKSYGGEAVLEKAMELKNKVSQELQEKLDVQIERSQPGYR